MVAHHDDGELIACDANGRADFQLLRWRRARSAHLAARARLGVALPDDCRRHQGARGALLHHRQHDDPAILWAFDLIELLSANGAARGMRAAGYRNVGVDRGVAFRRGILPGAAFQTRGIREAEEVVFRGSLTDT